MSMAFQRKFLLALLLCWAPLGGAAEPAKADPANTAWMITASALVMSVRVTRASGSTCFRSQSRSRCVWVPVVTTRKRSSASRVTVTSASTPPRSLQNCV